MFQLFSNKKEGKRSLILDIQSGLVRGAIVLKKDDNSSLVTSLVTKAISGTTEIKNAEHLTKRTIKLLSEVVEHLARDNGSYELDKIEYILSSPWVHSKLKTVKVKYDTETVVDKNTLMEIIKEDAADANTTKDSRLIERNIFDVRLNGYPTTNIVNKKAHELEVSLVTSFSSDKFLSKVSATVTKFFNCKNDTLHSGLLLQYTALRNILNDKNEFIYIHVHSELTDMIIIKDGLCRHIASYPFGIKTLLRKVSKSTKETIESSDSMLSLYQGSKLSEVEQNRMKDIVNPLILEWNKLGSDSFKDIFDITNIPKTVYLSAHSHFDLFKQALIFDNSFNFDVISYESIDVGDNNIIFAKGVAQSNMMKIYAIALNDKI